MKTAIFLLVLALGFMWYRGDLNKPLQEIESFVNPQASNQVATQLPQDFFRAAQLEVGQEVRKKWATENQNKSEKKTESTDAKGKPVSVDVFTKEKSSAVAQAKWLEGNKVKTDDDERLLADKFHKLASEGKFE